MYYAAKHITVLPTAEPIWEIQDYTPKHGGRLNIAECELSVLGRQCPDRRIDDGNQLADEVTDWEHDRNASVKNVNGQFTTANARIKLRRPYPQFIRQDERE